MITALDLEKADCALCGTQKAQFHIIEDLNGTPKVTLEELTAEFTKDPTGFFSQVQAKKNSDRTRYWPQRSERGHIPQRCPLHHARGDQDCAEYPGKAPHLGKIFIHPQNQNQNQNQNQKIKQTKPNQKDFSSRQGDQR